MTEDQKYSVLAKITEDEELAQDLRDLLLIEERKDEKSRPFKDFLSQK